LLRDIGALYFRRLMALFAFQIIVLPLQHISGQRVIEGLRIQSSYRKIAAVMLLVAVYALLVIIFSMQSGLRNEASLNLSMTSKTTFA